MRYVVWKDPLWGRFHATGTRLWPQEWDRRRHALAHIFTQGREVTSTKMYPHEMVAACDYMDQQLDQQRHEKSQRSPSKDHTGVAFAG